MGGAVLRGVKKARPTTKGEWGSMCNSYSPVNLAGPTELLTSWLLKKWRRSTGAAQGATTYSWVRPEAAQRGKGLHTWQQQQVQLKQPLQKLLSSSSSYG